MDIKVHNTFFTGRFLIHLPSVDSTNNFAKEHIANSNPIDGTVILADEQFAGRGQIGNTWATEPNKNLTFSIIYNTSFLKTSEQFYLNIAVSLGIWSALKTALSSEITVNHELNQWDVVIKWPNDILVNQKKICGILIENTIYGTFLKHSVIGIGININQTNFPNAPNACSLAQLIEHDYDRLTFFETLLVSIEHYFFKLRERKFASLKQQYLEHLFLLNQPATFQRGNDTSFLGTIIGIDEYGRLLIQHESGIDAFAFKEIAYQL